MFSKIRKSCKSTEYLYNKTWQFIIYIVLNMCKICQALFIVIWQHRAKGAYCPFRMKARVKFCTWCQEDGQIITFCSLSYSFLNHLTVRNLFWSNQLSWGYHKELERTVMVDRDSWLHFKNKQLLFFPLLLTCCIVYIIHVYNSIQYIYTRYIMVSSAWSNSIVYLLRWVLPSAF